MANPNSRKFIAGVCLIAIVLVLVACGAFGGRYHIDPKALDGLSSGSKMPLRVAVVLTPELCEYVYVSKRQGAKRIFEMGDALCTDMQNMSAAMFKATTIVPSKSKGLAANADAVIVPRVVDTSALVRPGAPPDFEVTMIYECAMFDPDDHPIFVRTIKENKVLETFDRDSWKTVMQTTVDAVYASLAAEMTNSPEIRKYIKRRMNERRQ